MSIGNAPKDTPKEALESYLNHLRYAYYTWYARSVRRNYILWLTAQIMALCASFGTALAAALMSDDSFKGLAAGRITLVVLPVLGWLAATVTAQSRVYQRWKLREEGRRQFQFLWDDGMRRFAAATSPQEYSAIHADLVKQANHIEDGQSVGFFDLAPSFTADTTTPQSKG
jgi:hypothetical protein